MADSKKGGLTRAQEKILEELLNRNSGVKLVDLPGNRNNASFLARGNFIELLHGRYFICNKGREYAKKFLQD